MIGKYRHKVTIETDTEAQDSYGQPIKTPTVFAVRTVAITPLTGRELEIAKRINADTTHKVEMRYLAGLTTKMRVVYQGRPLEILSIVNQDERNRYMTLLCVERAGAVKHYYESAGISGAAKLGGSVG